jgi:hypothetical protein
MPRKPVDYSKCKFYQLVCKDVTVKECYVGHTTDVKSRRSNHKSSCTNKKGKLYNSFVYKFIRDHGSWTNWQLIVHETAAMKDKAEAALRERHWLVHYNATLNSQVPGQTDAEYYVAHAEEIKAEKKEYYVAHVEEKKAYNTEYYAANTEKIKAAGIAYYETNAEKIKAAGIAYYAANADRLKKKHTCECGGHYTTQSRLQHFKTAKHLAFAAK